MKALRIICGLILALIALFVGGCSIVFAASFLAEPVLDGYGFWQITVAGLVICPFITLGAWLLLRPPDSALDAAAAARRPGPWPILGGVTCAMIALLMVGEVWFLLAYGDELDTGTVTARGLALYLGIGAVAAGGAFLLLRHRQTC